MCKPRSLCDFCNEIYSVSLEQGVASLSQKVSECVAKLSQKVVCVAKLSQKVVCVAKLSHLSKPAPAYWQ